MLPGRRRWGRRPATVGRPPSNAGRDTGLIPSPESRDRPRAPQALSTFRQPAVPGLATPSDARLLR